MFRTEDGAIVGSINVAELTEEEKAELGLTPATDEADDDDDEEDLSKLYKAELVERAEAAGIDTEGMSKADLVAALEESEGA